MLTSYKNYENASWKCPHEERKSVKGIWASVGTKNAKMPTKTKIICTEIAAKSAYAIWSIDLSMRDLA